MKNGNLLAGLMLAALVFSGCECANTECTEACDKYESCQDVMLVQGNPCYSCNILEVEETDPGVKCADCVLATSCEEMVASCSDICAEAGEKWGNDPPDDD